MQLAVIPILVGPLQTLLALLPAILVAVGTLLATLATPQGMKRVCRFFWHQKLFSLLLICALVCWFSPWTRQLFGRLTSQFWGDRGRLQAEQTAGADVGEWPMFRGGRDRLGSLQDTRSSRDRRDQSASTSSDWEARSADEAESVFSSPAIAGEQVIFATASGIGPFNPTGRGAIVSVDLQSGRTRWRYSPDDYRATFSSPAVAEGFVVCGEGLHLVRDARVTCLDLNGNLVWQFPTKSHVEATPAIDQGRVFVAAGDDGFYCLSLREVIAGKPKVLWHLQGDKYQDCESSPLVVDDLVVFGLGEGGQAVCTVEAATGKLRWQRSTSHPVFAPASRAVDVDGSKHFLVGLGRGNFVQSADDLLQAKITELQASGATAEEVDRVRQEMAPAGEIWSLDQESGEVRWKLRLPETVLGAIAVYGDFCYIGCRDGMLYQVAHRGPQTGEIVRRWYAREPIVTSPAVTADRIIVTTTSGRVHCLQRGSLEPMWSVATGSGGASYSSPTIAAGRVIVGTADQGLLALSLTARERPPVWNRGWLAGLLDQTVPTIPNAFSWSVDPEIEGDEPREVYPPAMLPDQAIAAFSIPLANEAVITAWSTLPLERLLDPQTGELQGRFRWQHTLTGRFVAAPVVSDGVVIAAMNDTPQPEPSVVLTAWNATDGQERWQVAVAAEEFLSLTVDDRLVYVWTDDVLTAWTVREGRRVWQRRLNDGEEDALPTTVAMTVADGLLIILKNNELLTLDGASGISLRPSKTLELESAEQASLKVDSKSANTFDPAWMSAEITLLTADSKNLYVVQHQRQGADRIRAIDLVDLTWGEDSTWLKRSSPMVLRDAQGKPLTDWTLPMLEEGDEPATDLSAAGGRVFYLTATGRLVCVASEMP